MIGLCSSDAAVRSATLLILMVFLAGACPVASRASAGDRSSDKKSEEQERREAEKEAALQKVAQELAARSRIPLWSAEEFRRLYPQRSVEEGVVEGFSFINVSTPTLYVFPADKPTKERTAVILCPGGAYGRIGVQGMGLTLGKLLNARGITCFILCYRTIPPATRSREGIRSPEALDDIRQAVRLVRNRAKDWNIDPERIGVIGESAGANLILNLLQFTVGTADAPERKACRPDFAVLLSLWPGGQTAQQFALGAGLPPVFMAHAEGDSIAPIAFAESVRSRLTDAGVSVQYCSVLKGDHTCFTVAKSRHMTVWPEQVFPWLRDLGLLSEPLTP